MSRTDGVVGEFLSLKEGTDADLLAMQVGDFYEFFGEDAERVSEELDLKVSKKSSHGSSYPMAGVPVDDLTPYLKSLVERGLRVAVADQRSSDDTTREIVRVVSPGTLLEVEGADARYLGAVVETDAGLGVAFADVTTGRFHATTVEDRADVFTECYRFDPVELLPGPTLRNDDAFVERVRETTDAAVTLHGPNAFAPGAARHAVREQFGAETVAAIGLDEPAVMAAGAVLDYVEETGAGVRASMTRLQPYRADDHVELDATSQRNLELLEPMGQGGESLVGVVDHTRTAAGSRLLKAWLARPRRDLDLVERRQERVAELASAALAREAIRDELSTAADLERLVSRAVHGSADARDLLRVRDTLALLPRIEERVESTGLDAIGEVLARIDREPAADVHEEVDAALVDDPPSGDAGGLFRRGYDEELDAVAERHEEAKAWVDSLADREKRRHGITHLQVGRNRTDGYYIQVGQSETDAVPDGYREIKTLKNSRRYTTDELEERERELLRLEDERAALERERFAELREGVANAADVLQGAGRAIAEIDVLASFAEHAAANGWVRPEIGGDGIDVEGGRHPVVEQTTEFVPNDARLAGDRRFLLVTGPNMSGKSTYMRQVALIVLLTQVGSFVPAERARIDPVDGIFTRVGALDELAGGRSTFMVEMQELSRILHAATEDSLVILDEVGRGTATYDGISIAWAATEYLHNEVGSFTLFATHYHELTALAERLARVENVHVSAEERDGDVTFLRTVRDGATDRSYGVHVADLAGVPAPVVDRAEDVLGRLREEKAIEARGGESGEPRQVVFDLGSGQFRGSASADGGERSSGERSSPGGESSGARRTSSGARAPDGSGEEPLDPATESVLSELRDANVEELSPLELMGKVQEWRERLDG